MFDRSVIYLLCFVVITVMCDDAMKLRKEILDMQDHARVLTIDNDGLVKKLEKLKHKCQLNLEPLRRKQELVHKQNLVEAEKLTILGESITQKNEEERLLTNSLQSAFVQNRKYTLQIELLTQELEIMAARKRDGKAEMCQKTKGLFHKYEGTLSLRSTGSLRLSTKSSKDEIVVLHNQLNQDKLRVQSLLNKNKELRAEMESYGRTCDMQISQLQDLLAKTQDELKEALDNIDLFQLELQDVTNAVKDLEMQLSDLRNTNGQLKDKAVSLKNMLEQFSQDMECYRKLSQLNIQY